MGVVGRIDSAGENTIVEMGKTTKDLLCQRKRERATGRRGCDREEGRSSTGLGPEDYGCQEGEADSNRRNGEDDEGLALSKETRASNRTKRL